ncbi:symmetrical bis(5'-nucleosyl)-tetraphosphatase [Lampropedia puyangensis]|uniref:Bis(5'-nucleosyl)-tetraphosphatase, symmetrical n=1 Tax=Lampropedia puyangensis TaxID=1330072 RepID=A0A4S8FAV8_9BURK|nr:symmetrical bis(5'-nucleosyl)-tetraphosphatase [Lampropedia puyangensis]THU03654.1 symmetrical bis(5'-nucleosyl)-tetraphosphatase [Lampropedia puyangensis]
MAKYVVGDVQGCNSALQRLLDKVDFSPSRDHLYLVGDLVNRGPESLAVLRRCVSNQSSISVILGNHDLHLLARYYGVRKAGKRDTMEEVLEAPDVHKLMAWLRQQPLVRQVPLADEALLLVHAGLLPQWSVTQALALAAEVHAVLADEHACLAFMREMYGNLPDVWSDSLQGMDRLRVIVNACTRLRFCTVEGRMDFDSSESADQAPEGLMPWFDVPGRSSGHEAIAFGHWSTLGLQNSRYLIALDTGCVWGGCLSALRLDGTLASREIIQVKCEAAQTPG